MQNSEPVMIWGSVGLLVGMVIRYFVPDVSNEFVELLAEVVSVAGPTLVGLYYARSKVTPVAKLGSGQKEAGE